MTLEPWTEHQDWDAASCRAVAHERQGGLCALCWQSVGTVDGGQYEAHHRLRRRDLPGWCPCNIVVLHPRCHTQGPHHPGTGAWAVHDYPDDARVLGLIVPTHQDPRLVPVRWRWLLEGSCYLDCEGTVVSPLAVPWAQH